MQETYKPNFTKIPVRAEFHDAVRRTDGQTQTMYLTHGHARNIQTKFHENPSESRVSRCGQTNGRTDRREPCIWHM